MLGRPTILERAFQLARSGTCGYIHDIRRQLASEGYLHVNTQLYGRSLAVQLRKICMETQAQRAAEAASPSSVHANGPGQNHEAG